MLLSGDPGYLALYTLYFYTLYCRFAALHRENLGRLKKRPLDFYLLQKKMENINFGNKKEELRILN